MGIKFEIKEASNPKIVGDSRAELLRWLNGAFKEEFKRCGYLSPLLNEETFLPGVKFVPYFYEGARTNGTQIGIRTYFANKIVKKEEQIMNYILDQGQLKEANGESTYCINIDPGFYECMTNFENRFYKGKKLSQKFLMLKIPSCVNSMDFLVSFCFFLRANSESKNITREIYYNRNKIGFTSASVIEAARLEKFEKEEELKRKRLTESPDNVSVKRIRTDAEGCVPDNDVISMGRRFENGSFVEICYPSNAFGGVTLARDDARSALNDMMNDILNDVLGEIDNMMPTEDFIGNTGDLFTNTTVPSVSRSLEQEMDIMDFVTNYYPGRKVVNVEPNGLCGPSAVSVSLFSNPAHSRQISKAINKFICKNWDKIKIQFSVVFPMDIQIGGCGETKIFEDENAYLEFMRNDPPLTIWRDWLDFWALSEILQTKITIVIAKGGKYEASQDIFSPSDDAIDKNCERVVLLLSGEHYKSIMDPEASASNNEIFLQRIKEFAEINDPLPHNGMDLDHSISDSPSLENEMNDNSAANSVIPQREDVNLLPSYIRHGRANMNPIVISRLKELLTKNLDSALFPIEKALENASSFWNENFYSNKRKQKKQKRDKALETIYIMRKDRIVTLSVIDDLQGKHSSFPLHDSRVFNTDYPKPGTVAALLLDVHQEGCPRYFHYNSLRDVLRSMSHGNLFTKLDDVIRSVTELLSQWLDLDLSSVKKLKDNPCACCNTGFEKKLLNRSWFKECGNNCQVSFYCLKYLGKVYMDPKSKDICEACHNTLSKNLDKRRR